MNNDWKEYPLEKLLSYEQPTPYIVESTEYNDAYKTPVLTAGKTFVIGHTKENTGIYTKLPVIIFDDFTTSSQYVNFPFKVKSSAMKILTANPEYVLPKFIFYRMQIIEFDHSTHKRFWIQQYSKLKVKVPALPEQERIVSRIEELFSQLDAAVAELQTVKEKLNVYRQSILVNAFNSLPDFQETVLGELLIEKPRNGFSPKGVNHETKYRNLTLSATTGGTFRDGFFKYIDINIEKNSHLWVKKQDILIQRANTIDYVGTAAIYTGEDDQYVYPDLMMKCHVKQGINPFFVLHQLHLKRTQKYYRDNATGTAGNMPKINQKTVMKTPVLITDRQSQDIVVDLIEKHLAVCQDNEVSILRCMQQASALRQSILKQAFEGNL